MGRREEPIRVARSSMPPFEEYAGMIRELWESRWLTNMGPKHDRLRELLKAYMQVENIELLPEEFLKYKNPEADKTAIKEAIKEGKEVAGARIVYALNLQIK